MITSLEKASDPEQRGGDMEACASIEETDEMQRRSTKTLEYRPVKSSVVIQAIPKARKQRYADSEKKSKTRYN